MYRFSSLNWSDVLLDFRIALFSFYAECLLLSSCFLCLLTSWDHVGNKCFHINMLSLDLGFFPVSDNL